MSKKKERGFFICPRWSEIAPHATASPSATGRVHGSVKVVAAIENGQPLARSTLRKILLAVQQETGKMFDVDAYIVDQRTALPR